MKRLVWLPLLTWLLLACLCLTACQANSIFNPARYKGFAKCLDSASFENGGICMEHSSGQNALVGDEPYAAFIWQGKSGETMPDFPSPENTEDGNKRCDCLRGGMGFEVEKRTILFCEGVPNLGDYLMYEMTECPAVYIPDSVKSIGEHTFPENTGLVIHCHAGSYAEQYAKAHGMKCEIVEE